MVEISTSLLGAKREKIVETIYDLEMAKTDYFHIDVMDGEFVKNKTHDKMLEYCEYLNHVTKVPLDVHLMVKDIKNYIDSYQIFNPNIISFHCEACKDEEEVQEIIKYAKDKVRRVGIAIKPDTNIEEIYIYLPYIHVALVMTVNPGEGGQMLIPETIEKIKILSEYREKNNLNYDIEADGGVKLSNSKELIDAGADILVSGSGILESKDYAKTIKELRV